jgi:hypothetical protein
MEERAAPAHLSLCLSPSLPWFPSCKKAIFVSFVTFCKQFFHRPARSQRTTHSFQPLIDASARFPVH